MHHAVPSPDRLGPWGEARILRPLAGGSRNGVWLARRGEAQVVVKTTRRSEAALAWAAGPWCGHGAPRGPCRPRDDQDARRRALGQWPCRRGFRRQRARAARRCRAPRPGPCPLSPKLGRNASAARSSGGGRLVPGAGRRRLRVRASAARAGQHLPRRAVPARRTSPVGGARRRDDRQHPARPGRTPLADRLGRTPAGRHSLRPRGPWTCAQSDHRTCPAGPGGSDLLASIPRLRPKIGQTADRPAPARKRVLTARAPGATFCQ